MAQQIIDTGAAANDGTGEPLRDAFTAVNENFTEIYTAGPVGSNVVISGNTITVNGVNNNLVLRANGIGNIQANSTIMPSIDAVYDIGAPAQRVDTVYAQYFVGNGSGITGVTAAAASNISLSQSNVTVTAGGPVTIGIQNTSNTVVFGAANTTFKGHVLPAANVTYDLGSVTQAWNDLYLSGNTVYLNNATITSDAAALTFTNQAGGTFVLSGTGQSGSNIISNGSSNVNIAAAAGPVTIGVAGVTRGTFNANGLQVTGGAITASGNIVTGGFFIGDVIGNITGNLVVPGANTEILFNELGNAAASPALRFDYVSNLFTVLGNTTISGAINAGSLTVTGNISGANVLGGANVNATLFSGATVSVTGNVTGGNLLAPGAVIATLLTGGNLQVTGGVSTQTN
jgi:hypothetical protein